MAKIHDGEFFHEECWKEIAPRGALPITYRPATTTRYGDQLCAHCGEIITEDDR